MPRGYCESFEARWKKMYDLAKSNYEYYGFLNLSRDFKTLDGITYDENGENLYNWIHNIKGFYRRGTLREDRKQQLLDIGVKFNERFEDWYKTYLELEEYYKRYERFRIKSKFITNEGVNIKQWAQNQRNNYKKGKLSDKQIELLKKINFVFNPKEEEWFYNFELASKYFEEHEHLKVKRNEITHTDFKTVWIATQRNFKKNGILPYDKEVLLLSKGMIFDNNTNLELIKELFDKYNINYLEYKEELKNKSYQEIYSRLMFIKEQELPIIINGKLNNIMFISHKELKEKYNVSIEQLICMYYIKSEREKVDFKFVKKENTNVKIDWDFWYKLATNYYNKYNDLNIPGNFTTFDGIEHNNNGYRLGVWIQNQRSLYLSGQLKEDRIEKLDKIEMIYDMFEYEWLNMYKVVKDFYLKNGHIDIPMDIKVNNKNLKTWLDYQRKAYRDGKLSKERYNLLLRINYKFDIRYEVWLSCYNRVLEQYYETGKASNISKSNWLTSQIKLKEMGKLSLQKECMLDQTGVIYNRSENKEKIKKLLNDYNIDYKYFNKLKYTSYQEVYSKLCFICDNNFNIIEDGNLNIIFSMPSYELEKKYGVNISQLICMYYNKEKQKVLKK